MQGLTPSALAPAAPRAYTLQKRILMGLTPASVVCTSSSTLAVVRREGKLCASGMMARTKLVSITSLLRDRLHLACGQHARVHKQSTGLCK